MHPYLEKIEELFDALIVPALVAVLGIVVLEVFFTETAHHLHSWIKIADTLVITIFVGDLGFKLYRATNWEGFLRNHWLEVVAIMPFFLVFRIIEGIFIATDLIDLGQHTAHLAEGARSGRFTRFFRSPELARSTRFGRFIRALSRMPRFAKAAEFYKHPSEHRI